MKSRMLPRPPKMRAQPRGAIGSVQEWLKQPHLFVTRREMWALIKHYDMALERERTSRRWWRRLLTWLRRPIRPMDPAGSIEEQTDSPEEYATTDAPPGAGA